MTISKQGGQLKFCAYKANRLIAFIKTEIAKSIAVIIMIIHRLIMCTMSEYMTENESSQVFVY